MQEDYLKLYQGKVAQFIQEAMESLYERAADGHKTEESLYNQISKDLISKLWDAEIRLTCMEPEYEEWDDNEINSNDLPFARDLDDSELGFYPTHPQYPTVKIIEFSPQKK